MIEVLVMLDPRDGNDPLEAVANLPQVPRVGDTLDVWVNAHPQGSFRNGSQFLTVDAVLWATWAPERVVVSVTADTYDRAEVEEIMRALHEGDQP